MQYIVCLDNGETWEVVNTTSSARIYVVPNDFNVDELRDSGRDPEQVFGDDAAVSLHDVITQSSITKP